MSSKVPLSGTITVVLILWSPLIFFALPYIWEAIQSLFYRIRYRIKYGRPQPEIKDVVGNTRSNIADWYYVWETELRMLKPPDTMRLEVARMFDIHYGLRPVYEELEPHLIRIFGENYKEKFPLKCKDFDDKFFSRPTWDDNEAWARMLLFARRGRLDYIASFNEWTLSHDLEKRKWQIEMLKEAEKILVVSMSDNLRFCFDPTSPNDEDEHGRRYRVCTDTHLQTWYLKTEVCLCNDIEREEYFDQRILFPCLGSPALFVYAEEGIDVSGCVDREGKPAIYSASYAAAMRARNRRGF